MSGLGGLVLLDDAGCEQKRVDAGQLAVLNQRRPVQLADLREAETELTRDSPLDALHERVEALRQPVGPLGVDCLDGEREGDDEATLDTSSVRIGVDLVAVDEEPHVLHQVLDLFTQGAFDPFCRPLREPAGGHGDDQLVEVHRHRVARSLIQVVDLDEHSFCRLHNSLLISLRGMGPANVISHLLN